MSALYQLLFLLFLSDFLKESLYRILARILGSGNPCTLVVGMQISIATMENSMGVTQKLKIRLLYDPAVSLLDLYPKKGNQCIKELSVLP